MGMICTMLTRLRGSIIGPERKDKAAFCAGNDLITICEAATCSSCQTDLFNTNSGASGTYPDSNPGVFARANRKHPKQCHMLHRLHGVKVSGLICRQLRVGQMILGNSPNPCDYWLGTVASIPCVQPLPHRTSRHIPAAR